MDELALRHNEMVRLMMRALNHDAHEAERLKLGDLSAPTLTSPMRWLSP
jgi:hypothetical protein